MIEPVRLRMNCVMGNTDDVADINRHMVRVRAGQWRPHPSWDGSSSVADGGVVTHNRGRAWPQPGVQVGQGGQRLRCQTRAGLTSVLLHGAVGVLHVAIKLQLGLVVLELHNLNLALVLHQTRQCVTKFEQGGWWWSEFVHLDASE